MAEDEERELEVDCLVIGAGPVGSVAAGDIAEKGHTVLLIEKRQEIGVPVRCGEGISKSLLDMLGLEPDPEYVSMEMDGAKIHSPSGHTITLGPEIAGPEVGFVIRREAFDQMLARMAVKKGADLMVRTEAVSFKRENGKAVVDCRRMGRDLKVRAKIVIAADGFESLVARWAGIDTSLEPGDIDSCIQYEMVGVETDGRYTEFFLGKNRAPGGYVWCFPKGDDIANVGLGINGSVIKDRAEVKGWLDRFISEEPRFKKGKIVEINGGGVSVGLPLQETYADNLLIVGDAARMIDPLTGGGVYNGCLAALKAAETVDEALSNGKTDARALSVYQRKWRKGLEMEMARNYLAKEKLMELSDESIDKVLEAVAEYDLSEISTEELLKAVASKFPEEVKGIGLF